MSKNETKLLDASRREFIRNSGVAGLALLAGGVKPSKAYASSASHPLIVTAAAFGGVDVSQFCDPKCGPLFPLNNFQESDYTQVGPFTLGPASPAAVQFFQKYNQNILLVNGVYAATVDHNVGGQLAVSGSMEQNFPCLGAIAAATYGPTLGLPFVSGGGSYDETDHLISKISSSPALVTAMSALTATSSTFSESDFKYLAARQQARLALQVGTASMPSMQSKIAQVKAARDGWAAYPKILATVADLQANVPLVADVSGAPGALITPDTNNMFLTAQIGLAGYVNNATVSLNLTLGSFDQHGGFPYHLVLIDSFFIGLDYFWRAAKYLGIDTNVVMMTGSDFTRSPYVNVTGGKDHWPGTSSSIVMGAGVTGGRVIGSSSAATSTDAGFNAVAIDPTTLQPAASGVVLQREHLHYEMRRVCGLQGQALDTAFPINLPTKPVRLFS